MLLSFFERTSKEKSVQEPVSIKQECPKSKKVEVKFHQISHKKLVEIAPFLQFIRFGKKILFLLSFICSIKIFEAIYRRIFRETMFKISVVTRIGRNNP